MIDEYVESSKTKLRVMKENNMERKYILENHLCVDDWEVKLFDALVGQSKVTVVFEVNGKSSETKIAANMIIHRLIDNRTECGKFNRFDFDLKYSGYQAEEMFKTLGVRPKCSDIAEIRAKGKVIYRKEVTD